MSEIRQTVMSRWSFQSKMAWKSAAGPLFTAKPRHERALAEAPSIRVSGQENEMEEQMNKRIALVTGANKGTGYGSARERSSDETSRRRVERPISAAGRKRRDHTRRSASFYRGQLRKAGYSRQQRRNRAGSESEAERGESANAARDV